MLSDRTSRDSSLFAQHFIGNWDGAFRSSRSSAPRSTSRPFRLEHMQLTPNHSGRKVSPDNTQVAAQARTNYYEPEATDPYPATRRSYPCCNPENHQKLLDGARSPETTGDHESPLAHARETTREIFIWQRSCLPKPNGRCQVG